MDAGLAAVCGALAGSVATIGAAFAAGWSSREQAKITARAEHRRQRRDARQAIYENFIAAGRATHAVTKNISGDPVDFSREEYRTAMREMDSLHVRVHLAGPASLHDAAHEVAQAGGRCFMAINEFLDSGDRPVADRVPIYISADAAAADLREALWRFIEGSHKALDDDGTT
ncbi:hypothetical protein [Streptomyces californicus]|uniref:hypothetical protein n=1 Tax=Streptomyces californicus TaxID=67351 RepID=UPI0033A52FE6